MSIRDTIIDKIIQIADQQHKRLALLTDDLALLESGLDSLCIAILVATLDDMLGIDPSLASADRDSAAAKLWPSDTISATEGYNVSDDGLQIVHWLQGILTFDHVRPGADRLRRSCLKVYHPAWGDPWQ